MARKDALLRLHQRLLAQRDELERKLAEDLGLTYSSYDGTNDIGETAAQMEQSELHSQLAALESRELTQIDLAISKIRDGSYGRCDRCTKAIPAARLQALPFTAFCIDCQRQSEDLDSRDAFEANWASALDYERKSVDHELNLSDLDVS